MVRVTWLGFRVRVRVRAISTFVTVGRCAVPFSQRMKSSMSPRVVPAWIRVRVQEGHRVRVTGSGFAEG